MVGCKSGFHHVEQQTETERSNNVDNRLGGRGSREEQQNARNQQRKRDGSANVDLQKVLFGEPVLEPFLGVGGVLMNISRDQQSGNDHQRNLQTKHPSPSVFPVHPQTQSTKNGANKLAQSVHQIGVSLKDSAHSKRHHVGDDDGAQRRDPAAANSRQSSGHGELSHRFRTGTQKTPETEPELGKEQRASTAKQLAHFPRQRLEHRVGEQITRSDPRDPVRVVQKRSNGVCGGGHDCGVCSGQKRACPERNDYDRQIGR
ncbi:hypothetical protein OGAPHI_001878 [Ogataea philodendri]|uniref:Uncharacterized protein n=1 Tax=Ogataea philodendri TaxID=1378263 RepID=A0A9P8PAX3_9ASCO|nr:uncharacterized protein OGAPHI_001878 [Ogataea philodendri]KAH3668124.1 hypothetical protein OGAPHI_001878 [Ogataea philodendri]